MLRFLYRALQVGHLGGELRLGGLRQLSVQAGRHGLLPALLVLVLEEEPSRLTLLRL